MQKIFAVSEYRHRATAAERRAHGGKTVTTFLVGIEGSDASTWKRIDGYGPTPGERKTDAIRRSGFLRTAWCAPAASGCSRNPTSARIDDECTCWDYENPSPSHHSGFCPLAD